MLSKPHTFDSTQTQRHSAQAVAFVLGVLIGGAAFWPVFERQVVYAPAPSQLDATENATSTTKFARSAPVKLIAPSIGLSADFETPLKLNPDKTVEVPDSFEKVGWYEYGATPGEIGPATVLGHVDSYKGPAVFYNLGKLTAGDEVSITRADGTTATFVVDMLERYDQDEFPAEKVYGAITHAGLRLVTCSGVYNKKTQKYSHNLVVFATLKE